MRDVPPLLIKGRGAPTTGINPDTIPILKITYKKMQKGDVKETHASILETVNYTSYKPSKKIEDGIKEFVSWYKKFKY